MIKKEMSKNGLVELFRFLCSVWVAYFHGFFPILSDKFDGVNISIDFFFMVSGIFFLKSIEKLKDKPFFNAAGIIFWSKIKRIVVPFIIAALSILCCNIIFEFEFNKFNWPLSFLWFFAAQFVYLTLFYLIYRKIKRKSTFNIICVAIICVTLSTCLFDNETLGRVLRGSGAIAMGILVSQIPKIKIELNDKFKAEKITLALNVIGFTVSALAFSVLAYLPNYEIWKLHTFICIVCTSLLYFATAIPVRSKFLNLLGEISTFIYLAQCPILLHYYGGTRTTTDYFGWLCFYTVVLFVVNRIANQIIKNKKSLA